jgi:hypothetical protein
MRLFPQTGPASQIDRQTGSGARRSRCKKDDSARRFSLQRRGPQSYMRDRFSTPEGAMALPADFPQPPADRESLAAAVAWIFQVLSWVIARAAAGDRWWIGQEGIQSPVADPRTASSDRVQPSGSGGSEWSGEAEAAESRTEIRPPRSAPASPVAVERLGAGEPPEVPKPRAQGLGAPPAPLEARQAAPRTNRTKNPSERRARAQKPLVIRRSPRPCALHPRPTTGPPSKSECWPIAFA